MVGAWKLSLAAAAAGLLGGGEALRPQAGMEVQEAARQPDFAAQLAKISAMLPKDRSELGAMDPAAHKKLSSLSLILPMLGALQSKASKVSQHAPVEHHTLAPASHALEQPKKALAEHSVVSAHATASGTLLAPKAHEPNAPPKDDFIGQIAKLTNLIATIAAKKKGAAPAAPAVDAAAPAEATASGASEKVKALSGLMSAIAGAAPPGAAASLVELAQDDDTTLEMLENLLQAFGGQNAAEASQPAANTHGSDKQEELENELVKALN